MPAEKAMAPHPSTLAWKIPWMEEPGRLQSTGSLRIWHHWVTSLSLFTFMHWRRKWQPLQCSCLENPRDGGAWWAAVYGVAQSRTRLERLSSSSSRCTRGLSFSRLTKELVFTFIFLLIPGFQQIWTSLCFPWKAAYGVVNKMYSGVRLSGFLCWLCHLTVAGLRTS